MAKTLTITVDEAAEALGISRNNAYLAVRQGTIPSIRIGRRIIIPKAAFKKMLEGVTASPSGEAA